MDTPAPKPATEATEAPPLHIDRKAFGLALLEHMSVQGRDMDSLASQLNIPMRHPLKVQLLTAITKGLPHTYQKPITLATLEKVSAQFGIPITYTEEKPVGPHTATQRLKRIGDAGWAIGGSKTPEPPSE